MIKRIFQITTLLAVAVLTIFSAPQAAEKPEIIRHDATYLEKGVSIVVQWQSANPVTLVTIAAGSNKHEPIKVDEYDNRRNASGYSGEVSIFIPVESAVTGQPAPPFQYTVQLKDDLGLRSDVVPGKVSAPVVAGVAPPGFPPPPAYPPPPGMPGMPPPGMPGMPPPPGSDDAWGQSHLNANVTTQQQAGGTGAAGIVDKLLTTMERHDTAPTMNKIKVNIISPETVSFSSKAVDDKGLREVKFKILDAKGLPAQEQIFSNLGKNWEGTTQTFQLGGGSYRVIAQAIDSAGSTSKEQTESFTLTGPPSTGQSAPPMTTPTTTPPPYPEPAPAPSPYPAPTPPPSYPPAPAPDIPAPAPVIAPPPAVIAPAPVPPPVSPPPQSSVVTPPVVIAEPVVPAPAPVVAQPLPDTASTPASQADHRRPRQTPNPVADGKHRGNDYDDHNKRQREEHEHLVNCRAQSHRAHSEVVHLYQRARAVGNISPNEARAFVEMEERLNHLTRSLSKNGLTYLECQQLMAAIANEKTRVQRMARF